MTIDEIKALTLDGIYALDVEVIKAMNNHQLHVLMWHELALGAPRKSYTRAYRVVPTVSACFACEESAIRCSCCPLKWGEGDDVGCVDNGTIYAEWDETGDPHIAAQIRDMEWTPREGK